MLPEGTAAPRFELPALVEGSHRRVALEEFLGRDVVILAFYPADFNPACDETSCDLDELDLFTMQRDVTVLAIGPDSVYSHRRFAETYDLKIPLLADTDREVAAAYDVDVVDDLGQHLTERAVAVVDHDGVIRYSWSTTEPERLPSTEAITDAIAETGGDDTAFARYRVGYAHFTEGRRAFTAAMNEFADRDWMLAQGDFRRAREEFEAARTHFDSAGRFVDDPDLELVYDGANAKSTALWQAADWLAQSASAFSSGRGAEGQDLRDDAERPLDTARGYERLPDPDDWPPETTDLTRESEATGSGVRPQQDEEPSAELGVDIDEVGAESDEGTATAETANGDGETGTESAVTGGDTGETTPESGDGSTATRAETVTDESTVDDADIEALQAELSAKNATSSAPAADQADASEHSDGETAVDSADGETSAGNADGDVTLDLTDPSADGGESPAAESAGTGTDPETADGGEATDGAPDEPVPAESEKR